MSRRALLPIAVTALLLGAVPALADANGSTETQRVSRACNAPADNRYTPPGPNDCKNGATQYMSTHNTNNVKCGETNQTNTRNPSGVMGYRNTGNPTQGVSAGMCSEGGSLPAQVPVQGRAGVDVTPSKGAKVVVDGDRDNTQHPAAQGYVIAEARPQAAAPTVRCGDEYGQQGKADSDSPEGRDTQAECGD